MQRRWMAVCVAGATLAVAACGGGGGSSSSASSSSGASAGGSSGGSSNSLTGALESFDKHGDQTITLSFYGDTSELSALSKPSSSTDAKTMGTVEKLLPGGSITVNIESGAAGTGKFELALNLPGDTKALDLISSAGTEYLRADVKGIAGAVGANDSKLLSEASGIESTLPWVGPLIAGNFVSVTGKSFASLAKSFGSSGASGAATTATSVPFNEKDVIDSLKTALTANAQITDEGSDSVGEHYQIVAQPQQLAQALYAALSKVGGPFASEMTKAQADVSKLSTKPVTVGAWVKDGSLAQVQLDLRQFDTTGTPPANPLGLQIDFASEAGSITIPTNATVVDLSSLANMFSGLTGKSGGAGAGIP